MLPEMANRPSPSDADASTRLTQNLYAWWQQEQADWDAQVLGNDTTASDLWESMPTVDSKTVARMAPIFEKHTGHPFDVRRIRPGGYASIEEVIQHLVPEMTGRI